MPPVSKDSYTILDGFTLLYACRAKLPHEAIKANISSLRISIINKNDLVFFNNLTYLDCSDNQLNNQ